MDRICEQQFMKERKEEEKRSRSRRRRRARGDAWPVPMALDPPPKKGQPTREYPDPPSTLRKMIGSTGRTSYELTQKLDALHYSRQKCADGGEAGRRGAAKVPDIDPKTLPDWAHDPKSIYPRGDLRQKYTPRG